MTRAEEREALARAEVKLNERATRIERYCPRCRFHGMHWVWPSEQRAVCSGCGHAWRPRLMRRDV